MPIISSDYKAPLWIGGKHAQTIIPSLFRKVTGIEYRRERLTTRDDDFLDVDWLQKHNRRLLILSHGLEGSSYQPYILGMAKLFSQNGWDILAWNFRGCSGEPNSSVRLYHGGCTDDLKCVIDRALEEKVYQHIGLIGFSLGGNITLKYLGDYALELPSNIIGACAFSVPCDLYACARSLSAGVNRVYLNRFLDTLKAKMIAKAKLHPGLFSGVNLQKIEDFIEFDNYVTAPMNGFRDAVHYYTECSSKWSIPHIRTPTLIVNAQNDPFLHPACFPHEACQKSRAVTFEFPYDGGHQGFTENRLSDPFWSEKRALAFMENLF
ncbi:MAG: hypothetical protein K940chlam2_00126 [Chlamydiae bacterium]|nr:hypothetical protein [Chlamydiota bacterium]